MSRQQQIEQFIYAKRRRLQGLELKEARYGINTPPKVFTEIEDLNVEIETLEAERAKILAGQTPTPPPAVSPLPPVSQPSLALTLSVEPERVAIGREATWMVSARNDGDDPLRHVTVIRGRMLLDAPFDLAVGQERRFTFTTGAQTSGEYIETITAVTGDGASRRTEARATVQIFEPVRPSLVLSLAVEPEEVTVGDEAAWTVTVHNHGNDLLRHLIVRHGRTLLDDPFDLPVGQERSFTFTTSPETAGEQTQTVTVSGMASSGDSLRDEAGATVQVRQPKARSPQSKTCTERSRSIQNRKSKTVLTHPFQMELIRIPASEFLMGSDPAKDQDARENEQPQHTLILPDFYIARYPVTKAQFAVWKGDKKFSPGEATQPAVDVTWHDAVAFCRWLT